jgi:DNA helicase-2/ATP-dependent DNA helicase PcrA
VGSLKFYEREEIKDALAFLSLIANPRDEIAFRRIINKPARGIGQVTQDRLVEFAREKNRSLVGSEHTAGTASQPIPARGSLLEAAHECLPALAKKARQGVNDFLGLLEDLIKDIDSEEQTELPTVTARLAGQSAAVGTAPETILPAPVMQIQNLPPMQTTQTLSGFIEKLIALSGLAEYHSAQDEISGTQRIANLQELINSAVLYPRNRAGLLEFLDHIELDRSLVEETAEDPDSVMLITLHNTKGLEFSRVIITGLESGIFPRTDKTPDELEEERRLFYVGITRARDELYLTSCAVRRLYGRTEYMEISPFLLEIDRAAVEVLGTQPAAYRQFFSSKTTNGAPDHSPQRQEHPLAATWKKGRRVYHDDYGYGVICRTAEDTDGYVITVQFETGHMKRFMPEFQQQVLMLVQDTP